MSDDRVFVDTNVLVYAYDADAGPKHGLARDTVAGLWHTQLGAVSIQVLQEFYVTATRKLAKPISRRAAREMIETYDAWLPHRPSTLDVVAASDLEERHRLSFWDALVIVSAQRSNCTTLLTEDLNDGQRFGSVRVRNPFA